MRVILALVLFVAVASAVPQSTCEQKNKALKTAVFNLAKRSKVDCNDCYNDILAAATECILSFDWKNCIEDILGTIHILRRHLNSTKLNLITKSFIETGLFSQNKRVYFSTLHFD